MEYLTKQEASIVRERKTVVIERALEDIYKRNGNITPKVIIDAAKSTKNELHKFFVWDDRLAGERYRLAQATAMILATRFVCYLKSTSKTSINVADVRPVRKFLPYKDEGFRARVDVLGDKDSRQEIIERKKSVLRGWCDSVVDIEELLKVREAILAAI